MDLGRVCYGCFREKPEGLPVCPYCGFNAQEEPPFLALPMGTILRGRYLIGKVLGIGGFGITYLSYDLLLEIEVAIKEYMPSGLATRYTDHYRVVLTGNRIEDYESGLNRFLDEARILAKLRGTPNIVSVQDHFRENNTAYFVMEYVDGISLKAYLVSRSGKIPYDQALTILQPIMEALIQVHGSGLTHRDISPDNIFITSNGKSKLLDFGAARYSSGEEKSVSVILKHGFAPEEQYSSHGNQGPWTDVYAMGATLYRCITGELPPDSIARVHLDTLKRPSELGISLPVNIETAIMKAMAVKAQHRYPSMGAFLQAVTGGNAESSSRKVAKRYRKQASENGKTRTKPPKKCFALKITALIVCIAVSGLGIWKFLSESRAPSDVKTSEPSNPVSESGSSVSEPSSIQPAFVDYSNSYLNLSMKIPADFKETDPESAVFISSDGSCSLQIGFYTYWSGFPVYSLTDVESNTQKYVQYFIGILHSTDITDYRILSEGYQQIGALNSYRIQFEATEKSGSTMRFLAVFIDAQNGFGCYNVIASYPQGNDAAEEKVLLSVESFQCLGPAGTSYKLLSDATLPFQFMYADDVPALDFKIENGILTAISMADSDYFILTVSALSSAGTETVDGLFKQVTEGLSTVYPSIEPLDEQKTQNSGGMEWIIQNYTYESEGIPIYMSYSVSIWQDHAYLMIITSSQEAQLDNNGLRTDIMGSLRPVA